MTSQYQKDSDSFRELVKSIEDLRWENMPEKRLKGMYEAIESVQRELADNIINIRAMLNEDIEKNDVVAFEKHQQKVRNKESHYKSLDNKRSRIYSTRQRIIIREGMRTLITKTVCAILEYVILALIFVVLGILLYETYLEYDVIANDVLWTLYAIDASACAVFLGEFFLRRSQAEDKKWFWKTNWIDFVSSIPIPPVWPGLDANTWARMFRLLRILRLWRAFRILSFLWRGMERLQQVMDVRLMQKSLIGAAIMIIVGSVMIYSLQEAKNPYAGNFFQSMWWSFNTVTTGSFADLYPPDNMLAQVITGLMIIAGLVVISVFIGTLASAYRGETETAQHELQENLATILNTQTSIDRRLTAIENRDQGSAETKT